MEFCWHGCAAFSLKLDGVEFLVDPFFSGTEDYGPWYIPNDNAPPFDEYFRRHDPRYLMVTHGHFDHCDLETIRKVLAVKNPTIAGSFDVVEALEFYVGASRTSALVFGPGEEKIIESGDAMIQVSAHEGIHWITGEEGREAARKLAGRPDRYGVMPCGGPMLAFVLRGREGRVLISGDNTLEGLPRTEVDVAVLYVGGAMYHPATKVKTCPVITPEQIPQAVSLLKPRVLIPVHYDSRAFIEPLSREDVQRSFDDAPLGSETILVLPPYNEWVDLPV